MNMVNEILYATAIDKDGNLIHIDDAVKGIDYYCPECKKEFILHKSGKTGQGSKRPHFKHNELSPNCKPETVLHSSFKKMLINLLEKYKSENSQLILNWICYACHDKNSGNILEKVTSIKEEYTLEKCRPDIALLDDEKNVNAVVEVVVTHSPEESVLHYYSDNNIVLIQINLSSEEDLKRIEEKIKNPDIVDFCLSPSCSNTNKYKIDRRIHRRIEQCGRCMRPIERFDIDIHSVFGKQKSLNFTEEEIDLVKSKRNNIKTKTNKTTKEKYPVSDCINCRRKSMSRGNFRL
jgi:hypothetical protein